MYIFLSNCQEFSLNGGLNTFNTNLGTVQPPFIGEKKMAKTNFFWGKPRTLITYDLSNNQVSASDIAKASNWELHTLVVEGGHTYFLPNTTLLYAGSEEQAKSAFIAAFNKAKPAYSSCVINRLLITEVSGELAYIED